MLGKLKVNVFSLYVSIILSVFFISLILLFEARTQYNQEYEDSLWDIEKEDSKETYDFYLKNGISLLDFSKLIRSLRRKLERKDSPINAILTRLKERISFLYLTHAIYEDMMKRLFSTLNEYKIFKRVIISLTPKKEPKVRTKKTREQILKEYEDLEFEPAVGIDKSFRMKLLDTWHLEVFQEFLYSFNFVEVLIWDLNLFRILDFRFNNLGLRFYLIIRIISLRCCYLFSKVVDSFIKYLLLLFDFTLFLKAYEYLNQTCIATTRDIRFTKNSKKDYTIEFEQKEKSKDDSIESKQKEDSKEEESMPSGFGSDYRFSDFLDSCMILQKITFFICCCCYKLELQLPPISYYSNEANLKKLLLNEDSKIRRFSQEKTLQERTYEAKLRLLGINLVPPKVRDYSNVTKALSSWMFKESGLIKENKNYTKDLQKEFDSYKLDYLRETLKGINPRLLYNLGLLTEDQELIKQRFNRVLLTEKYFLEVESKHDNLRDPSYLPLRDSQEEFLLTVRGKLATYLQLLKQSSWKIFLQEDFFEEPKNSKNSEIVSKDKVITFNDLLGASNSFFRTRTSGYRELSDKSVKEVLNLRRNLLEPIDKDSNAKKIKENFFSGLFRAAMSDKFIAENKLFIGGVEVKPEEIEVKRIFYIPLNYSYSLLESYNEKLRDTLRVLLSPRTRDKVKKTLLGFYPTNISAESLEEGDVLSLTLDAEEEFEYQNALARTRNLQTLDELGLSYEEKKIELISNEDYYEGAKYWDYVQSETAYLYKDHQTVDLETVSLIEDEKREFKENIKTLFKDVALDVSFYRWCCNLEKIPITEARKLSLSYKVGELLLSIYNRTSAQIGRCRRIGAYKLFIKFFVKLGGKIGSKFLLKGYLVLVKQIKSLKLLKAILQPAKLLKAIKGLKICKGGKLFKSLKALKSLKTLKIFKTFSFIFKPIKLFTAIFKSSSLAKLTCGLFLSSRIIGCFMCETLLTHYEEISKGIPVASPDNSGYTQDLYLCLFFIKKTVIILMAIGYILKIILLFFLVDLPLKIITECFVNGCSNLHCFKFKFQTLVKYFKNITRNQDKIVIADLETFMTCKNKAPTKYQIINSKGEYQLVDYTKPIYFCNNLLWSPIKSENKNSIWNYPEWKNLVDSDFAKYFCIFDNKWLDPVLWVLISSGVFAGIQYGIYLIFNLTTMTLVYTDLDKKGNPENKQFHSNSIKDILYCFYYCGSKFCNIRILGSTLVLYLSSLTIFKIMANFPHSGFTYTIYAIGHYLVSYMFCCCYTPCLNVARHIRNARLYEELDREYPYSINSEYYTIQNKLNEIIYQAIDIRDREAELAHSHYNKQDVDKMRTQLNEILYGLRMEIEIFDERHIKEDSLLKEKLGDSQASPEDIIKRSTILLHSVEEKYKRITDLFLNFTKKELEEDSKIEDKWVELARKRFQVLCCSVSDTLNNPLDDSLKGKRIEYPIDSVLEQGKRGSDYKDSEVRYYECPNARACYKNPDQVLLHTYFCRSWNGDPKRSFLEGHYKTFHVNKTPCYFNINPYRLYFFENHRQDLINQTLDYKLSKKALQEVEHAGAGAYGNHQNIYDPRLFFAFLFGRCFGSAKKSVSYDICWIPVQPKNFNIFDANSWFFIKEFKTLSLQRCTKDDLFDITSIDTLRDKILNFKTTASGKNEFQTLNYLNPSCFTDKAMSDWKFKDNLELFYHTLLIIVDQYVYFLFVFIILVYLKIFKFFQESSNLLVLYMSLKFNPKDMTNKEVHNLVLDLSKYTELDSYKEVTKFLNSRSSISKQELKNLIYSMIYDECYNTSVFFTVFIIFLLFVNSISIILLIEKLKRKGNGLVFVNSNKATWCAYIFILFYCPLVHLKEAILAAILVTMAFILNSVVLSEYWLGSNDSWSNSCVKEEDKDKLFPSNKWPGAEYYIGNALGYNHEGVFRPYLWVQHNGGCWNSLMIILTPSNWWAVTVCISDYVFDLLRFMLRVILIYFQNPENKSVGLSEASLQKAILIWVALFVCYKSTIDWSTLQLGDKYSLVKKYHHLFETETPVTEKDRIDIARLESPYKRIFNENLKWNENYIYKEGHHSLEEVSKVLGSKDAIIAAKLEDGSEIIDLAGPTTNVVRFNNSSKEDFNPDALDFMLKDELIRREEKKKEDMYITVKGTLKDFVDLFIKNNIFSWYPKISEYFKLRRCIFTCFKLCFYYLCICIIRLKDIMVKCKTHVLGFKYLIFAFRPIGFSVLGILAAYFISLFFICCMELCCNCSLDAIYNLTCLPILNDILIRIRSSSKEEVCYTTGSTYKDPKIKTYQDLNNLLSSELYGLEEDFVVELPILQYSCIGILGAAILLEKYRDKVVDNLKKRNEYSEKEAIEEFNSQTIPGICYSKICFPYEFGYKKKFFTFLFPSFSGSNEETTIRFRKWASYLLNEMWIVVTLCSSAYIITWEHTNESPIKSIRIYCCDAYIHEFWSTKLTKDTTIKDLLKKGPKVLGDCSIWDKSSYFWVLSNNLLVKLEGLPETLQVLLSNILCDNPGISMLESYTSSNIFYRLLFYVLFYIILFCSLLDLVDLIAQCNTSVGSSVNTIGSEIGKLKADLCTILRGLRTFLYNVFLRKLYEKCLKKCYEDYLKNNILKIYTCLSSFVSMLFNCFSVFFNCLLTVCCCILYDWFFFIIFYCLGMCFYCVMCTTNICYNLIIDLVFHYILHIERPRSIRIFNLILLCLFYYFAKVWVLFYLFISYVMHSILKPLVYHKVNIKEYDIKDRLDE